MVADFQVQVGRFVFHRAAEEIVNASRHVCKPRKNAANTRH
jgi:hypothetical protein